jgi:ketosteroid isomerase-like protein
MGGVSLAANTPPMLPTLFTRALHGLLWLACSIGLLSGCTSKPRKAFPQAAEILAAAEQLQKRFAAGDLLGVADFYRSDALLVGSDGFRIEGREAIDSYWAEVVEPVEWRLETRTIEGGAGLAYQRGTSYLTSHWDGGTNTSEVEFLLIWTRDQSEGWKILLDANWERSVSPKK